MSAKNPRSWLWAVMFAAAGACDSAEGAFPLPNEEPWDAGATDGHAAADACFAQNVCAQNSDCLPATCDCAGGSVAATDRCVAGCCLSTYATCLRACADAGTDDGGDASGGNDASDTANDAPDGATDS